MTDQPVNQVFMQELYDRAAHILAQRRSLMRRWYAHSEPIADILRDQEAIDALWVTWHQDHDDALSKLYYQHSMYLMQLMHRMQDERIRDLHAD